MLNLFFCSFKSWNDLFFCSRDSCAERMCAVWSCRVRACFLRKKMPIVISSRSTGGRSYLSSAVLARWTRFFVQSPVATNGFEDGAGWAEVEAVVGVAIGKSWQGRGRSKE